MNAHRLIKLFIVVACALGSQLAAADTPRQIKWDDLALKDSSVENPFTSLSLQQLGALTVLAELRDRKARGVELSAEERSKERAETEKFKQWAMDPDALLAKREAFISKKRELAQSINKSLDGQLVRMSGYMLPLEFSGKQTTEFLLVPWVGACIHTPPPALNQIVHVKADKPIDITAMFAAVWVTGRIAANASRKEVFITDGVADIDVGYAIGAANVERYSTP